ncbi:MAG: type II toxin-antitoxin system HicA family toxin [Methylotenera sp.]|nr:type II toxin-antitoxin system HicA family toxin [Methylotenera sp.]
MGKVKVLSGKEVCLILLAHGFEAVRQKGSHAIMQKQIGSSTITVPVPQHKELKAGTLTSIISQAQLSHSIFENQPMNIRAKVYCNGTNYYTDEIDISSLTITDVKDYCIQEDNIDYLNIFQDQHVVPDVWRYNIKVYKGKVTQLLPASLISYKLNGIDSNFRDRSASDVSIESKVILLVLESPHKSEYVHDEVAMTLKPKAPAQGKSPSDAGGGIKTHLHNVLKGINLTDGCYSLIICNPIPYMCSLGFLTGKKLNKNIRNNVWEAIWYLQDKNSHQFVIREDFVRRCKSYSPEYILNCCTTELSCFVNSILIRNSFNNLYQGYHPASNWNVGRRSVKRV